MQRNHGFGMRLRTMAAVSAAVLVIVGSIAPFRVMKEVRDLPVEKYDLVLNDFECITSLACARKKVPSVNFGHQASFLSNKTPLEAEKTVPALVFLSALLDLLESQYGFWIWTY